MRNTTLCYLEKDGKYLMLHRTKKEKDVNKGKWLGIGGGFEGRESPEECAQREIFEETGLTAHNLKLRGIVTFDCDVADIEYMFIFTTNQFTGEMIECNEGDLVWIEKENILSLNLWEGDKYFLELINNNSNFFSMKLTYKSDELIGVIIDGKKVL